MCRSTAAVVALAAIMLTAGCRSEPEAPATVDPDAIAVVKRAAPMVQLESKPPLFDVWIGATPSRVVEGFPNDWSQFSWKVMPMVPGKPGVPTDVATFINGPDRSATSQTARPAPQGAVPASAAVTPQNGSWVGGNGIAFAWPPVPGATNYNLTVWDSSSHLFGDVIFRYRYFREVRWQSFFERGELIVSIEGAVNLQDLVNFCGPQSSGQGGYQPFSVDGVENVVVEIRWKVDADEASYVSSDVKVRLRTPPKQPLAPVKFEPIRLYENKMSVACCIAVENSR